MVRLALAETIGAIAIFAFLSGCSGVGSNRIVPEQSDGAPIKPESLTFSGHLYVADAAGVQRFPSPILTYSTATSPIAVDSSNRLYTENNLTIKVYAPGSTTVARTLNIIASGDIIRIYGVQSLVLDSTGNLYVGVTFLYCIPASVGCMYKYRKGAFIYAPDASGSPVPRVVWVPGCAGSSTCAFQEALDKGGLALDSHGDLLIASNVTNKIYTIASPLTTPVNIRTISGSGVQNPAGLAVDTSGVLYVDNRPSGSHPFIAAFPVTANGNVAPTRVISVAGAVSFGNGIATGGGHLFIPDVSGNSVDEVSSLVGGTQTPFKLAVTSPEDAKLAP